MIADLNYLRTMSGGDEKFINEMIELFREQVAEYREQMPDLLHTKSYDDLSKIAHKAKSSVAVMGMTKVAELLGELEKLSHEAKNTERYEGMVKTFIEQSEQALAELETKE